MGSPTCFLIFCHKCDWLRYIGNAIEFNINHLFNHQIVIPFFCNFPQLLALVCGWKLCWKKYMSPTKIFHCRILKQFVNPITLLCDGKCHCNAAKTVLRQLIVAYLLKALPLTPNDVITTKTPVRSTKLSDHVSAPATPRHCDVHESVDFVASFSI